AVRVAGVGLPPERQELIQKQLQGLPRVTVEFSNPAAPVAGPPAASEPAGAGAPAGKIQAQIEQPLGGHARVERFSARMLERNEALMSRAYALRSLAQRFAAATEAGLAESDRKVLRQMAREHLTALEVETGLMQRVLHPILVSVGANAVRARAA